MSAVPIDAIAGWTHRKAFLSEINVRRDLFENGFFVDIPQRRVAFEATRENIEVFEIESDEDLTNLFFVGPTLNEETFGGTAARGKSRIPSQDDPEFGFRNSDDFGVLVIV